MTLTVSKLADRVGLTADTIRYYERAGLLPPPTRTASGYRAFDDDAVERLRFIKGAQRIGLRLQEIKELLDIRDRGLCPCGHTEDLLKRRVSEIDAEITGLQRRRLTSLRSRSVSTRSSAPRVSTHGRAPRSSSQRLMESGGR
jgi:DNA-binding transcriptional MerR regulator